MSIKMWGYLGITVALLIGVRWVYSTVYEAGWNAAVVEQERLITEARDEAVLDTKKAMQVLVDAAKGVIVREEIIVEKIKKIPVTTIVKQIVTEQPDCKYDVLAGVLSAQASASRSGTADSPGVAGEPDEPL